MTSEDTPPLKVLVTGGVRSGKSAHAEQLLAAYESVTYVAPGPVPDEVADPDWAARIRKHQARRPASWTTLETHDLADALSLPGPVLVDCLGTWLTAVLDEAQLWEASSDEAEAHVESLLAPAVAALTARTDPAVIVTNEVGLGVIPSHRSGRLFRDLLGLTNQGLSTGCDEAHVVISGRVLVLR